MLAPLDAKRLYGVKCKVQGKIKSVESVRCKVKGVIFKIYAFIKRDFLIEKSYRLEFFLRLISVFFFLVIFYFVSQLFKQSPISHLAPYGGDYFSFVLIGIAFFGYLNFGLNSFSDFIRREQLWGTLEGQLVSPTRILTIIGFSSVWQFIYTTFETLIYLIFGTFIFGVSLRIGNIIQIFLILILTVTSLVGLGMISASFILVFKRGDPLNWLITNFSTLLSGVYFPVTILPIWLQKISSLIPFTYTLNTLRHALLSGSSGITPLRDMFILVFFSIVFLPLGIFSIHYGLRKAKIKGSLGQY